MVSSLAEDPAAGTFDSSKKTGILRLQPRSVGAMAGRQRTFDLVPTTLAMPTGPIAPMTSKAAKKAYQKAQRGPRMSAAERRRAEAAELAAQKKEFEREKNAAKAKVAREKKAAKAQAERETRRKMGLPEPSKFVRASQPTISRFVRGGSKRNWEELDDITEDSDGTVQSSPKPVPGNDDSDDEFGQFPSLSQSSILEELDSSLVSMKEEKLGPKFCFPEKHKSLAINARKSRPKPAPLEKNSDTSATSKRQTLPLKPHSLKKESSDMEFGDFPSLSQCDMLEQTVNVTSSDNIGNAAAPQGIITRTGELPIIQAKTKSKHVSVVQDDEFILDNSQELADLAATQLLTEAADAVSRSDGHTGIDITPHYRTEKSNASRSVKVSMANGQADLKKTFNSSKEHVSMEIASSNRPVFKERSINMPPPPLPSKVGRSTTFAPSPNKTRSTLPLRATNIIKSTPDMPPSATQAFLEEHIDDFFPTPSQQIREMLEDIDAIPSNTQVVEELSPLEPAVDSTFTDLFSSQDFHLSAEDLLEITTPSKALRTQKNEAPVPAVLAGGSLKSETHNTVLSEKRIAPAKKTRFFEEKEDDLLHAAIHESAQAATTAPSVNLKTASIVHREKRRFFEEKEDDLLHAAIHESKMLAAAQRTQRFQPKAEIPRRSTRNLKRVVSIASDYGFDDEFSGCSQELLALP